MGRYASVSSLARWVSLIYGKGFTAIVDKQLSKKYEKLVDRAPELIKSMPWGPAYEVVVFRKPDFTALEVLNFATGGASIVNTGDCDVYLLYRNSCRN